MDRHATQTARIKALQAERLNDPRHVNERLFIGIFSTGIGYADRTRERHGDYARLAFLPFRSLVLEIERDCPSDLRARIEADAGAIIARRGQSFQVSGSGQTIILGS